jgi:hypothetical protein
MNHLLPKRRKRERFGTREEPQIRCVSHLAWVRGHACSVGGASGQGCGGRIEAAHVRSGTDGGLGVKPSDTYTIPLCSDHHAEQHRIGEASFEKRHGINMRAIADGLSRISPHRKKWEDTP